MQRVAPAAAPAPARRYALAAGMLFGISTAFPIAASLWSREAPAWIGALDVVLAFALVAAGGFIVTRWGAPIDGGVLEASARIYRGGSTLLLVLLVLFFLAGQRINWNILLPGLAWRGWLFAYVLPAWLAAWGGRQEVGGRR